MLAWMPPKRPRRWRAWARTGIWALSEGKKLREEEEMNNYSVFAGDFGFFWRFLRRFGVFLARLGPFGGRVRGGALRRRTRATRAKRVRQVGVPHPQNVRNRTPK